jgi:hypothetical protein
MLSMSGTSGQHLTRAVKCPILQFAATADAMQFCALEGSLRTSGRLPEKVLATRAQRGVVSELSWLLTIALVI